MLPRIHRPTRASIEFAAKAGVATAVSISLGHLLGLQSAYWAGISAVVATAGTLGASLGAAISRITATVVGLIVGLGALALPASGTIVSGLTVFVALLVLPALSLEAGARLGAASTLLVTAIPGDQAVGDALARGVNVPLGCAVAVVVGVVLLPRRAAKGLRADLRTDVERAGALARSALVGYVDGAADADLPHRLGELARASSTRAVALRDAAREPSERGERGVRLPYQVAAVDALVQHVGSLVAVTTEARHDRVQSLLRTELHDAADGLNEAAGAIASAASDDMLEWRLGHADGAVSTVDAAFADVRARRATVGYSTGELTRLLSVIQSLHAAASALTDLGHEGR
jgi:uncharacterized membrane protein YgaE (UPF0421/DUF939 family)